MGSISFILGGMEGAPPHGDSKTMASRYLAPLRKRGKKKQRSREKSWLPCHKHRIPGIRLANPTNDRVRTIATTFFARAYLAVSCETAYGLRDSLIKCLLAQIFE